MTDDRHAVIIKYATLFGSLFGGAMVVLNHLQISSSNYLYLYLLAILLCYLTTRRVVKTVSYRELSLASLLIVLVASAILLVYYGVASMF